MFWSPVISSRQNPKCVHLRDSQEEKQVGKNVQNTWVDQSRRFNVRLIGVSEKEGRNEEGRK